jgi:sugar O-acyltransferase (sialic acid O-acetyltransferase NeuD family)
MLIVGAKGLAKQILKTLNDAKHYFETIDNRFTIGIGNPVLRKKLFDQFNKIGGIYTTTISTNSSIGHYENKILEGCNIMQFSVITNSIYLGRGTLINQLASIGHDTRIGDFCEICPNVSVSGNCVIGNYTFIGSGASILPHVKLGQNVIVGANSVVNKDIPDNSLVVGTPAKIIKELTPLEL